MSATMLTNILVLCLIMVHTGSVPLKKDLEKNHGHIEKEFQNAIRRTVEEHHKKNDAIFDRIYKVNTLHEEKRNKIKKMKKSMIPDEEINEINSEQEQKFFEGDLILPKPIEKAILEEQIAESGKRKRNMIGDVNIIWPNRKIPYIFDASLSQEAKEAALAGMQEIHEKTCVRWVPYNAASNQEHFIKIKKEQGCYSILGRNVTAKNIGQPLSLGDGCESKGVALHEFLHAMGFYHEQSRDDRSKNIRILWENIVPGFESQFMKYSRDIDKMGIDYDMKSIMHYGPKAFSYGGLISIEPVDPTKKVGNTVETLTELDAIEINALYHCQECEDIQTDCKLWASQGECEKNPGYMSSNCRKSCDSCDVLPACEDSDTGCSGWAASGECEKNAGWMDVHCKKSCKTCAVSTWSEWSACDEKCQHKKRQRFCFVSDKSLCKNVNEYGIETQTTACDTADCHVIDGHWGKWSSWGSCSTTCDQGSRQRTRQCDNPVPSNGGASCTGDKAETGVCTGRKCNQGQYDVDFEDGWGIWSNNNNEALTWKIQSGPSYHKYTGPPGDHTLQRHGHYIFVNSSQASASQVGNLVSSQLDFSGPKCLNFYYSMYGVQMGILQLNIVPVKGQEKALFLMSGDQGSGWHKAAITLENQGAFKLSFKAIVGGSVSDMALDDIYIDNGACTSETTNTKPTCSNADNSCPSWAAAGECSRNPLFVIPKCQLECGLCGQECKDLQGDCGLWASHGECDKNPTYMQANCKKSCNLCEAT